MVLLFGFGVVFPDTGFKLRRFDYIEAPGFSGYLWFLPLHPFHSRKRGSSLGTL